MELVSRAMVQTALTAGILTLTLAACGTSGGGTSSSDPAESPSNVSSSRIPAPATGGPATGTTSPEPSGLASSATAIPEGTAQLMVSIQATAEAKAQEFVLACEDGAVDPSTTLPNAADACARVLELGAEFFQAKPDPNKMCTQQYGGPQTAEITGAINGSQVSASFSLTDGCQISRWNALAPVLGTAGAS